MTTAGTQPRDPGAFGSLEADLRAAVRGEVRFDRGSRALYATDASNYRQPPIGVVIPRDADDVVAAVATCRRHKAPVLPRGGGTSLAGQCCNTAVVLDMTKYMHRILALDPERRTARVQPGTILDHLRAAAERYHLTFAPDPSTHTHNTLGGMIGNNSCGVHSVMGGKTDDNIEELDILTYDGLRLRVGRTSDEELATILSEGGRRAEIYGRLRDLRDRYADLIRRRFPDIPRRVSGYNLIHLLPENGFHVARSLVGSEGTCVTVLEAVTRLVHSPPARVLVALGYPDVYRSADHIMDIMSHKPIGLEGIDHKLVEDIYMKGLHPAGVKILPEGGGWLLVEFGAGTREEADRQAHAMMDALKTAPDAPTMKLFDDPHETEQIWRVRESGLAATARIPGKRDAWPGWEDSAVHPSKMGAYLRDFRKLLDRYGYDCSLYGHFGQGCLHCRIDFDLYTRPGIRSFRGFMEDAADLVVRHGGSLSGEHGDGQARAELLPRMFGEELIGVFREFKSIWDPEGKMNPGKVVDPNPLDSDLRIGTAYNPPDLATRFSYQNDRGSFAYAVLRCVGVGECRKDQHGSMCPSYMATHEEKHSTRGRARMLFEMLKGEVVTGGWREKAVKEALDLCLSCKSCKGECPMQVDMAMYKAEFLSHYYRRRLRPVDAYAMGLIHWWSRLAACAPGVVNALTQTRPVCDWLKRLAGISTRRQFPRFAPETFTEWFARRPPRNIDRPEVILWPDTFNNHFYPGTAKAAVEVLEQAGYQVTVPRERLCCGRPLYDYGMLDLARRLLARILEVLRPQIAAGVPVIGLEPACLSTFREELIDFFPNHQNARRLSAQSFLLSEFLDERGIPVPRLERKAVLHGHCTHKTVLKMAAELRVLGRMGVEYELLDSGCCGVSGAFGFRAANYELSLQIGERVLLPAVRSAPKDTLVLADGFSCREQIAQCTDRRALHLSEALCMAMHTERLTGDYPERHVPV